MNGEIRTGLLQRAACQLEADRIITADEVAQWPEGLLDELLQEGVLAASEPAGSVECDACWDGHVEKVDFVEEPPGSPLRAYIPCPVAGRVAVDTERMRRWRIRENDLPDGGSDTPTVDLVGPALTFSDDYLYAERGDLRWPLSEKQAELMRILHKAHQAGKRIMPWHQIKVQMEDAGQAANRMRDVLRGIEDWEQLLVHPERGHYGLNL